MGIRREFMHSSAQSFLILGVGKLLAFAKNIIVARWLHAGGYGIYSYVLTLISITTLLGNMGLHTTIVRYVAAYKAQADWGMLKGVLHYTGRLLIVSSILIVVMFEIAVALVPSTADPILIQALRLGIFVIPFSMLAGFSQQALRGLKKIVLSRFPEAIIVPFVMILGVFLCMVIGTSHAVTAVGMFIMATALSALVGWYLLSKALPNEVKTAKAVCNKKDILSSSLPLVFVVASQQIMSKADVLILGYFGSMEEIGIYSAVTRLSAMVSFGLIVLNVVSAPMMSEHYANKNMQGLEKVIVLTSLGATIYAVIIAAFFYIAGDLFLGLFGSQFKYGFTSLKIITFGCLIDSIAGPVGMVLLMTGFEKNVSKVLLVTSVINISLNLIFIPLYGINGAAIAQMLSIILWNVWMGWVVYNKIGFNPTLFRSDLVSIIFRKYQ